MNKNWSHTWSCSIDASLFLLSDCQCCQYRQDHNHQDALIHTRDTLNGIPALVRAKLCTTFPNSFARNFVRHSRILQIAKQYIFRTKITFRVDENKAM